MENKISKVYENEIIQAKKNNDAHKLDLVLRSQWLFRNSPTVNDTVKMQFDEVKKINSNYYQTFNL